MKILIIANSSNIWVHSFVKNVISPSNDIYLLYSGSLKPEYQQTYKERDIVILGKDKLIYRLPKVGSLIRRSDYCKEISKEKFDCCIILNTTSYRLSIWNKVKNNIDKTVALYWGSDIHRVSKEELKLQKKYLDYVDRIVFTAENLKQSFMSLYPKEYLSKISVIQFGLDSLESITKVQDTYSRIEIKEELGIPIDKTIVAIGYCGIPEQQHLRIIRELAALKIEEKKNMCVMLQFMYNTKADYREQVINSLKNSNISYISFDRFLSPPELAKLRYATDIFINAQTTDALAGSVLETVYAGGKLINGSWLKYPEMKTWGVKNWQFDEFEELNDVLRDAMSVDFHPGEESLEKLRNTMSWLRCREKWNEFLGQ